MSETARPEGHDAIQQHLSRYALGLKYEDLPEEVVHAARIRVIDTLGVLLTGFSGRPARAARELAAQMPLPQGATIIGTAMKAAPDVAAFANGTTARAAEFNDLYHWPGSYHCHPSDVIMPVFAVAEQQHVDGRSFLAAVVLAYEVYQRFSDVLHNPHADSTNFCSLGVAAAAGKLFGLSPEQMQHCIGMAAVSYNMLTQARGNRKSMYKVVASGQAGRSGVFAAMSAKAGILGPQYPFVGKAGWCEQVAREQITFAPFGGTGGTFKILDSRFRLRPAMGETISSIIATERVFPQLGNVAGIERVTLEVYKRARDLVASREHVWCWDPRSVESANQSIPYLVAAALMDGTITTASFDDAHLSNPVLRALMEKIDIVENEAFTQAFNKATLDDVPALKGYRRLPREHRTRITVSMKDGRKLVGEVGYELDDISVQKPDSVIEEKFRNITQGQLGRERAEQALQRLWKIDEMNDIAKVPPLFMFA